MNTLSIGMKFYQQLHYYYHLNVYLCQSNVQFGSIAIIKDNVRLEVFTCYY